jgi:hypothetical protein
MGAARGALGNAEMGIGVDMFTTAANVPAVPTGTGRIALAEVLASDVRLAWDEAVTIVEELCGLLLATKVERPIPDRRHIFITHDGHLSADASRGGTPDPIEAARLLHDLLVTSVVPAPLRLFVSQAISNSPHASLRDFAEALTYFSKAGGQERLAAVHKRVTESLDARPVSASSLPASKAVPAAAPRATVWFRAIPAWVLVGTAALGAVAVTALVWWQLGEMLAQQSAAPLVAAAPIDPAAAVSTQTAPNAPTAASTGPAAQVPAPRVAAAGPAAPTATPAAGASGPALRSAFGVTLPGWITWSLPFTRPAPTAEASSPAVAKPVVTRRTRTPRRSSISTDNPDTAVAVLRDSAVAPAAPPAPAPAPLAASPAETTPAAPAQADALGDVAALDIAEANAQVYSGANSDVVPPDLIRQQVMPPLFTPRAGAAVNQVELTISSTGTVERTRFIVGPHRMADMMILSSAKTWLFTPASRNGEHVRYRLVMALSTGP